MAINVVGGSLLPKFEGLILVLHVLGFFAILIPLLYMSDYGTAKDVFGTWVNSGDWSSQGVSTLVGLIGAVFAFAGGDAAVHVSFQGIEYILKRLQTILEMFELSNIDIDGRRNKECAKGHSNLNYA